MKLQQFLPFFANLLFLLLPHFHFVQLRTIVLQFVYRYQTRNYCCTTTKTAINLDKKKNENTPAYYQLLSDCLSMASFTCYTDWLTEWLTDRLNESFNLLAIFFQFFYFFLFSKARAGALVGAPGAKVWKLLLCADTKRFFYAGAWAQLNNNTLQRQQQKTQLCTTTLIAIVITTTAI